ncbi:MAG TPA: FkbM family methyltransferase [Thermoanaerobaculia bacterium]|nr:FkbM family methyltransferase [Thermoanaerobaculia bacterium]
MAAIPTLAALAACLDRPLVVIDVGCRWGFDPRWQALGRQVKLIGFDADATECQRLREAGGPGTTTYVAAAFGAAPGQARLFVTREPACSSLYSPDPELIAERPELACTTLRAITALELTTLDDWALDAGIQEVDFLKLDTQGSELDILRGAQRTLRSVRALEVEVELNPIYRGQPLFGDVDRFLRERDFVLWRLGHLVHYGLPGGVSDFAVEDRQFFDSQLVAVASRGGQVFWGHALYVRREMAQGKRAADHLLAVRDACIATILGFEDLAASALGEAGSGSTRARL